MHCESLRFSEKFGLISVNFSDSSLRRVPKDSAFVLSDIARTRALPRALVAIAADSEQQDSSDEKAHGSKSAAATSRTVPAHFANPIFFIYLAAIVMFKLRS
jgi:hypothetical protein